ncbi:MAG: RNA methyltransferase, partial [Prevotellaceae bacterium]|nr:RNA methyltransferase [Prevotellaceae bacterium]
MLSKNNVKLIASLSRKKTRDELSLFVAEGGKLVLDLSGAFRCRLLLGTKEWLSEHTPPEAGEIIEVTENELSKASSQKTPQGVLAVFEK